ncbi:MAG: class I SAM-dependent methyltransferase [Pseudodesulfovibrio sp.]
MDTLPTWYNMKYVSELVHMEMHDLLVMATKSRIPMGKGQGSVNIHRDDMLRLFDEISRDVPRHRHDLTGCILPHIDLPWAKTLTAIYREDAAFPASISPQQGEFVRSVIQNINPKRCLEIGCFIGASTMWICSALEDCNKGGLLHSVDLYGDKLPFKGIKYMILLDALSYIRKRLEEAGLSHRNVQHEGNSHEIGTRYDQKIGEELDFLFIDGDHTIDGALKDFLLYGPHLKKGGYLLFHDIYPEVCGWDGPDYVIKNFIATQPGRYQFVDLNTRPQNYGMCLIKKIDN